MTKTLRQKTLHKGRLKQNRDNCPQPRKDAYPTRMTAEKALHEAWRGGRKNRPLPLRTYRCECGTWHLTKSPLRQKAAA